MPKVLLPTPPSDININDLMDEKSLRELALQSMGLQNMPFVDYAEVEMEISDDEAVVMNADSSEDDQNNSHGEKNSDPESQDSSFDYMSDPQDTVSFGNCNLIPQDFEKVLRERALKSLKTNVNFEPEIRTDIAIILGPNKQKTFKFIITLEDENSEDEAGNKSNSAERKQINEGVSKNDEEEIRESILNQIKAMDKKLIIKRDKIKEINQKIKDHTSEYIKSNHEVSKSILLINRLQKELKFAKTNMRQSQKACKIHKSYLKNFHKQLNILKNHVSITSAGLSNLTKKYEQHKRTMKSKINLDLSLLRNHSFNFLKGSCSFDQYSSIVSIFFPSNSKIKQHSFTQCPPSPNKKMHADLNPFTPICPYIIDGECIDKLCSYQHPSFLKQEKENKMPQQVQNKLSPNKTDSYSCICHICKIYCSSYTSVENKAIISSRLKSWHHIYEKVFFKFSCNSDSFKNVLSPEQVKDSPLLAKHLIFSLGLETSKKSDPDFSPILKIIRDSDFDPELCSFMMTNYSLDQDQKISFYLILKDELLDKIEITENNIRYCHSFFILLINYFKNIPKNSLEYQWLVCYLNEERFGLLDSFLRFAFIIIRLDLYEFVASQEIPFLTDYHLSLIQKIFLQSTTTSIDECISYLKRMESPIISYVPLAYSFMYCQYLNSIDQSFIAIDICARLKESIGKTGHYHDHALLYRSFFSIGHPNYQIIQTDETTITMYIPHLVFNALTAWSNGNFELAQFILEKLATSLITDKSPSYIDIYRCLLGISRTSICNAIEFLPSQDQLIYIWLAYVILSLLSKQISADSLIFEFVHYGSYLLRNCSCLVTRILFNLLSTNLYNKPDEMESMKKLLRVFVLDNENFMNQVMGNRIAQEEIYCHVDWTKFIDQNEEILHELVQNNGYSMLKLIFPIYLAKGEFTKLVRLFHLVRLDYPESEWFWSSLICVWIQDNSMGNVDEAIEICQEAILMRPYSKDIWKHYAYITSTQSKEFKLAVCKEANLFSDEILHLVRSIYHRPNLFFSDLDDIINTKNTRKNSQVT